MNTHPPNSRKVKPNPIIIRILSKTTPNNEVQKHLKKFLHLSRQLDNLLLYRKQQLFKITFISISNFAIFVSLFRRTDIVLSIIFSLAQVIVVVSVLSRLSFEVKLLF